MRKRFPFVCVHPIRWKGTPPSASVSRSCVVSEKKVPTKKSAMGTAINPSEKNHLNDTLDDDDDDGLLFTEGLDTTESFLVGISPSFWAHVPLAIVQIHQQLHRTESDGIFYLTTPLQNIDNKNNSRSLKKRMIPISKCRILGVIVCLERKSNGSIQFVLDDGTGLIDVLYYWDEDEEDAMYGTFTGLPTLTGNPRNHNKNHCLRLGEFVQVYGKIQNAGENSTTSIFTRNDSRKETLNPRYREIHATLVQPMQVSRRATVQQQQQQQYNHQCLDAESHYWLDCIRTQQKLFTSLDVLKILGPQITQQVANRENLPSSTGDHHDSLGLWRLFGTRCRCHETIGDLQQHLLYCHCIATLEPIDSQLQYRDALLRKLLDMERSIRSPDNKNESSDGSLPILQFQYSEILNDPALQSFAAAVISKGRSDTNNNRNPNSSSTTTNGQISHLLRRTFRALRKDGIVYLEDEHQDVYWLISRKRVLEPYVAQLLECRGNTIAMQQFYGEKPKFIDQIPPTRLQIVRRGMLLAEKNQIETTPNNDEDNSIKADDNC